MKKEKNFKGLSFYFTDAIMTRVFFVALIVVAILALIPAFRPSYSESEKRELTKFPKFTFESLATGEYFDNISLWYSDTFPLREKLISLNGLFKGSLTVKNSVEIHGDLTVGDDIPENDDNSTKQETSSDNTSSQTSSEATSEVTKTDPANIETLGAIIRVENSAFEYYNFNQKVSDLYAYYISYTADALKGISNVYAIVPPTSIGVVLPDDVQGQINSSDQKKAIEYIYNQMSSNVIKVNPYKSLRAHRDEYIYFRTDHHWTSLGAYYAYKDLMKAKDATAPQLDQFTKHEFSGFLGSFYRQTQSPHLSATPDTVVAYEPVSTNTITTTMSPGNVVDKKIVANADYLSEANKYLCFITGDRPYGVINNPAITDGSSCLIVKDSFGNAMVPFFVANYQTIHVIDYRHFSTVDSRKITQFVTDNSVQDVVFINNISSTRNESLVNQLCGFVY